MMLPLVAWGTPGISDTSVKVTGTGSTNHDTDADITTCSTGCTIEAFALISADETNSCGTIAHITSGTLDPAGVNEALTCRHVRERGAGWSIAHYSRKAPSAVSNKLVRFVTDAGRTVTIIVYVLSAVDQTTTYRTTVSSTDGGVESITNTSNASSGDLLLSAVYVSSTNTVTDLTPTSGLTEDFDVDPTAPGPTSQRGESSHRTASGSDSCGATWTGQGNSGAVNVCVAVISESTATSPFPQIVRRRR